LYGEAALAWAATAVDRKLRATSAAAIRTFMEDLL
jgi:hypothetical protein